jgi:TetR/AcrR family transcriptional repressor of nem operon
MAETPENSRTRLLTATIDLVRANGYAATRVEEICAAAGVTKGSFFHHFASKEDLAIAAGRHWGERSAALFAQAPYMAKSDPLERLLGYIRFRKGMIEGDIWEWSCYAGTTIQETHASHPDIRDACAGGIEAHLMHLRLLIQMALADYPVQKLDLTSLAIHIQAVVQGAIIMAKSRQDPQAARDSLDHLHRYVEMLFSRSTSKQSSKKSAQR